LWAHEAAQSSLQQALCALQKERKKQDKEQ
jgi:hypothetical protein